MRVAVICEFSGTVTKAFRDRGHDVISCDLEPSELPGPHIQGDVRLYDWSGFDLAICHPPCQYLSYAGMGHWNDPGRMKKRLLAFDFFMWCYFLPAKRVCIENPKGYPSKKFRKPDQIIQPYYFGDSEQKTTCLWLRELPPLIYAEQDELFFSKTHVKKPKPSSISPDSHKRYFTDNFSGWNTNRRKERSRFFPGPANAMAEQ